MTEERPQDPSSYPQQPAPPPPNAPPGYGYPYQPPPPTPSNANTALILGILSLCGCTFFTGIPAIVIGRNAMREIDASQGRLGGRSTANAGMVTGIIGTVLGVLGVMLTVAIFVIGGLVADNVHDDFHDALCQDDSLTLDCS